MLDRPVQQYSTPVGTPDTSALDDYLSFLRDAGAEFDIAPDVVHEPDHVGHPHSDDRPVRDLQLPGLAPIREHRDPGSSVSACHATFSVAQAMAQFGLVQPKTPFWDVGCGTGVLALAAASLGAVPIRGTDVSSDALALARRNVSEAGADIALAECSLLGEGPTVSGLVAANLPHKPSRAAGQLPLAHDGGPDGDRLFSQMLDEAEQRFSPGAQLLFFLHSLPHPRLLARVGREFELGLLSWKRRFFAPGEYGDLQDWFVERHAAGTSFVGEGEDGRRFLVCGVWLAERH